MEIVLDFVPLAQTVAKERVKDVKGVVKMDVKVDVQVAVHNLVVMGAVLAVKEVAWNIVLAIVWEVVKQDVCTIVETTA